MLTLMQGDCLEKLKTIPDGTVDLEACMWYGPEERE